ncbi:hypothetical protein L6452_07029 [Arctium lappa]|uniref:Uncharacterized protein n=1 Tax=Arctium lappa TaxID=4217 RepID=A0ACB9EJY6_ARCLA|nr:hypothetical protein L6452_07029 [Arctium lappa]
MIMYNSTLCSRVTVSRKRPVINVWDIDQLRARENAKIEDDGLGRAQLLGTYLGSQEVEVFHDDLNVKTKPKSDKLRLSRQRIRDNISRIRLIKWETEGDIDAALSKFPDESGFLKIKDELHILFNPHPSDAQPTGESDKEKGSNKADLSKKGPQVCTPCRLDFTDNFPPAFSLTPSQMWYSQTAYDLVDNAINESVAKNGTGEATKTMNGVIASITSSSFNLGIGPEKQPDRVADEDKGKKITGDEDKHMKVSRRLVKLGEMLRSLYVKRQKLHEIGYHIAKLFFPVIKGNHYICIVFNIKNHAIEILDNMACTGNVDELYEPEMAILQSMLMRHLHECGHPSTPILEEMDPEILEEREYEDDAYGMHAYIG